MTKTPNVDVDIVPLGGGFADHNLTCWLCGKHPAVYMMHPWWVFAPCRACQKEIISPVFNPPARLTFWRRLIGREKP